MTSLGSSQVFYRRLSFREALTGWLFILPAILGLILFNLEPLIAALYFSFTDYDIISPPKYIGIDNYVKLFTADSLYVQSIKVTLRYSLLSIPLTIIVSYMIALLMNQKVKGVSLYRTVWYLPSLVPSVASAALWGWLLNPNFGPVNYPLKMLGLPAPRWLVDPQWVVPALVLIRIWGSGNTVVIFLAGLQGVSQHLYEAAEVDGANWWAKLRHITIPMTSSIIFFNLVMGVISTFQVFTIAYVLYQTGTSAGAQAGPSDSALFYVLYLYRHAFRYFNNGYACAMAWVLCLAIAVLTLAAFRTQQFWVHYEVETAAK